MVMKGKQTDNAKKAAGASRDLRAQAIEAILKALRITYQSVQAHSQTIEKSCGVSAAQLWAMWELHNTPGLSVSDLASALVIHRSTSSNMLDKLERKKLVRRERLDPDQRVVRLYLTPEGIELLSGAPRPAQGPLTEALHSLPDDTLHCLSSNLAKLLASLMVVDEQAAAIPISELALGAQGKATRVRGSA